VLVWYNFLIRSNLYHRFIVSPYLNFVAGSVTGRSITISRASASLTRPPRPSQVAGLSRFSLPPRTRFQHRAGSLPKYPIKTRWDFSKRAERVDFSSPLVTTAPSSKCFAANSCLAWFGGRYLSRLSGASSIRPAAPTPANDRRALLTGE
jgi:hypothetical protein